MCSLTLQLMKERANALNAICLETCEEGSAHEADLLTCKEQTVKETASIMEHTMASIEYIRQQPIGASNLCEMVKNEFRNSTGPCLSGLKDITNSVSGKLFSFGTSHYNQSLCFHILLGFFFLKIFSCFFFPQIKETVNASERVVTVTEKKVNELLSHDYQTRIEEVLMENKNNLSESIATLNIGVATTKVRCSQLNSFVLKEQEINLLLTCQQELAQDTDSLTATLTLKFAELKETNNKYKQNEDEALGMFLEGLQSTSCEISEIVDSGKTTVNQIVSTNMSHDVPTGKPMHSFVQLFVLCDRRLLL